VSLISSSSQKILVVLLAGFASVSAGQVAATVAPASEVTLRHEVYRDDRLTAYLLEIPPGMSTQMHRHDKDILSVFFGGVSTTATFEGAEPFTDTPPPGAVRYRMAGFTHSTRNNDATLVFKSVVIEFNESQGPKDADPKPPAVLCTHRFCAEDLSIAAGQVVPTRAGDILVAISDVKGRVEGAADFRRAAGSVWKNAQAWRNTGGAPVRVIAIRARD
jgi:hypothetical protein